VNVKGTFNVLREAARGLRNGGASSISPPASSLRPETYGVYSATKAAVEAMTRILAKELRGRSNLARLHENRLDGALP
jgi:3-oxoacyl-[acyl-carrier protein] reductase